MVMRVNAADANRIRTSVQKTEKDKGRLRSAAATIVPAATQYCLVRLEEDLVNDGRAKAVRRWKENGGWKHDTAPFDVEGWESSDTYEAGSTGWCFYWGNVWFFVIGDHCPEEEE